MTSMDVSFSLRLSICLRLIKNDDEGRGNASVCNQYRYNKMICRMKQKKERREVFDVSRREIESRNSDSGQSSPQVVSSIFSSLSHLSIASFLPLSSLSLSFHINKYLSLPLFPPSPLPISYSHLSFKSYAYSSISN